MDERYHDTQGAGTRPAGGLERRSALFRPSGRPLIRWLTLGLALAVLALAPLACCCPRPMVRAAAGPVPESAARLLPLPTPRAVERETDDSTTEAQFRNVNFHVAPGVVLEIRRLRGQMESRTPGEPVIFDDKRSFIIRIASAEIALDTTSLGHLMNEHVFAYRGAPLRAMSFSTAGDRLVMRGILHKVIDIPFEITARVTVTEAGLLRVQPTRMLICSLDGKGLMEAVGIELADLLDVERAEGVGIDGNDLLLDPDRLLPPPAISGRVTAVRIEGGKLVQLFGRATGDMVAVADDTTREPGPPPLAPPDSSATNYMYFRHGTLRFGKLFMVRADMQIIDLDPGDSFEFSIDRYNEQLVAGYSRNTPAMGLGVFMPDLDDLLRATDRALTPAPSAAHDGLPAGARPGAAPD